MSKWNALRALRDVISDIALMRRNDVEVSGVKVLIRHPAISSRMRYVLSRGYEGADAELARQLLVQTDSVLECGSSIGFLAIYCKKFIGIEQYAMVEANPELLDLAATNFALNGVNTAECINAAVTNRDGPVQFMVNKEFWSSSLLERSGTKRVTTVEGLTLTSIRNRLRFKPDALIMDIEGAEADVPVTEFAAFSKLLLEVHPAIVGTDKVDALVQNVKKLGFRELARVGGSIAMNR